MHSVIVIAADQNYLQHAHSLMVNCRKQGEWKGDFCLILPSTCDPTYYESRGIFVLADDAPTYYKKFAIFDEYFIQQVNTRYEYFDDRWDMAIYLDVDVLVQRPLESLLHEHELGTILAVREPFDMMHGFTFWAEPEHLKKPEVLDGFRWLWKNYDPTQKQFNTGIMVYQLRTLPKGIRQELESMRERIATLNTHVVNGTDQPVFNLVCRDLFKAVRSRLFCYWYEEGPDTVAIHYNSGYAPWREKEETQNAYFNSVLNRPCHSIYQENLADFENVFPLK